MIPNALIGIPAWPSNYRASIHNPGIVCRNVDDFGGDRFNLDVGVFRRYGLLRRGVEVACFLRAAAHHLNGVHHLLFLVVVGVVERRGPREVFIHVAEDRRKRSECFDAWVPRQLVHSLGQCFVLQIRMRLHPPVGVLDLFVEGRRRQYLRHELVGVESDGCHQLLQFFGGLLGVLRAGRRLRRRLLILRD